MKPKHHHFTALLFALTLGTAHANLIAHYKFDSTDGTTTPDSAPGSVANATLNDLTITASDPKVGAGALEMSGSGDGATTSNTFAWTNDTRTISFWWKTKLVAPDPEDPENLIPADISLGTYISMGGSGTTAGGRFDVRELGTPNTATLRLEVQGGSNLINTNPAIDDGEWHLITIVVPNETSTLGEVRAYVDGDTVNDLFAGSTSTTSINTITSALRFGHSVLGGRVPNGFIDDVQVYNVALNDIQIASLYETPGSTIPFGDEIPPTVIALSPADNGVTLVSSNLTATFSEAIEAGAGTITLFSASNSIIESFDVETSPRINISEATLTIDPTSDLPGDIDVYVNITAGAIRDLAENEFVGILDSTTWNFATDATSPSVASINSPTTTASGVGVATPLQLSFSETVVAGSGTIVIRRVDDNTIVSTIDAASAYVIVNEANVTIVPPGGLPGSSELYIEFDAGAFTDVAGNPFAGSSGSGLWSFTTAPASDLLAHYRFDIDESGTTPDSAGSAFANLGSRVNIDSTFGVPLAGAGALSMNGGGTNPGASQGAVSSNTFAWVETQRTITFWWKTKLILNEFEELVPANVDQGTYFTCGTNAGSGTRFDAKEAVDTTLRIELQGITGAGSSNPAIDDGEWHFIAIVVPEDATFADIQWFVDGDPTDLNPSDSAAAVITGLGPIAFGDSIINVGNLNRVPNGYLDEAQVYRRALDQSELGFSITIPA
jgi:hypothetical protein